MGLNLMFVSFLFALGAFTCQSVISGDQPGLLLGADATSTATTRSQLVERCCQVGRERAIESQRFKCKLGAREALIGTHQQVVVVGINHLQQSASRRQLMLAAEAMLERDPTFGSQCELVLESCCLAHHRSRNCDSGKQLAKSGVACMDVELSKEASVATESFNDCCMACSLGSLAATTAPQNESSSQTATQQGLAGARCKLTSPLASSLEDQLYEQTYIECCQENLPRLSSPLLEPGAQINCNLANGCSQRCLQSGSLDPSTRQPIGQDRCDCFSGFKLAADGLSCLDIDECKLNLHTCNQQSEVCDNTRGGFRCLARSIIANGDKYHNVVTADLSSSSSSTTTPPVVLNHYQPEQESPIVTPANGQVEANIETVLGGQDPTGEPFASLRLCPPGVSWITKENRCQQKTV